MKKVDDVAHTDSHILSSFRGFCRIFEIEGVERSLYGYLIFTHCGVINTHCGEMPSLLRKQNSKTKWLFLVKKAVFGI